MEAFGFIYTYVEKITHLRCVYAIMSLILSGTFVSLVFVLVVNLDQLYHMG